MPSDHGRSRHCCSVTRVAALAVWCPPGGVLSTDTSRALPSPPNTGRDLGAFSDRCASHDDGARLMSRPSCTGEDACS